MDTKNLPTLPNSTDSPAHTTSSSPPSTSNPHFPSTHPPTLDSPSHPTPSTSSTPTEHLHHHAHFDLALSPHPSRQATPASAATTLVDIEHSAVENDPRLWSDAKKSFILVMVSLGSLTPTIGAAIYNPAFDQLREQLHATEAELALSISLFILFQGGWPIFWTAIAEVIGRKPVYLTSYSLFIIGTVVASRANTMPVLIGMRMIQAFGSSAVMAVGAGTLADIYEQKERGTKMGLYYAAPLIGPALGPLIGGALTQSYSWRATFYFIAALGGLSLISFIFFPDTWRRERSLAYQTALKRSVATALAQKTSKAEKKRLKGLKSSDPTPLPTQPSTRPESPSQPHLKEREGDGEVEVEVEQAEKGKGAKGASLGRRKWWIVGKRSEAGGKDDEAIEGEFKLSIRDVNPITPALGILKNLVNLLTVISSGFIFAAQYTIAFTAAVTFAAAPYNYDALKVGLVLVAFGGGNIAGSILGGRYSDFILARLKKANGGVSEPEMRLKSMIPAMPVMVFSFLGYAWTAQERTNIAGPVVFLFFGGFALMVIYASVLAFLVDSNPGRSSSAIACNSFFRGLLAFIMSEVALPIKNGIGDGGLYTLFAGLLALACGVFVLLGFKGKAWRDPDHTFRRRNKRKELERAERGETTREDVEVPQPNVP